MTISDPTRRAAPIVTERPRPSGRREGPAELSLLRIVNVVLRGRGLIAGSAVLVAIVVAVVGLARARTYSASASFVPQGRSGGSNLSGIAAQFGISVQSGEGMQSPQFYVDLLRSREILRDVVDTRYSVPTDTGAAHGTLADLYGIKERTPALRREAAIERLRSRLSTGVTPKTGVVTLTVTTPDAALSYQVTERLLALLNKFNLETRQSQAAAERRFAEQRLNEVKEELRAAENRLQAFLQRNRQYRNSPELQFEEDRLSREVSLRQGLYATLAQSYEQAKIDEVRDTPVITLVERPEVPVRADRRLLIQKGLLGLLAGAVVGLIIVLVRHFLPSSGTDVSDEVAEFAALRRETIGDLTHPWRPVARLLRRRPPGNY